MTCEEARTLIQDKVDGLLTAADSAVLDGHLETCTGCGAELEALLAIDAALDGATLVPAPRWLPDAVADEIHRRASVRARIERTAIGAGSVAAAAGVAVAIRSLVAPSGGAAGARLADAAARSWQPVGETLGAATRAPGFLTSLSQNPGVQGFVLALAAAALALLAVLALRLSKQLSLEWR